jgi:CO dehydrogenase/acetyl-CoA synthase epsilon subunit
MTAMAGFITLGIICYLIVSCLSDMRDRENQKKITIEDTEIYYENKQVSLGDNDETGSKNVL